MQVSISFTIIVGWFNYGTFLWGFSFRKITAQTFFLPLAHKTAVKFN